MSKTTDKIKKILAWIIKPIVGLIRIAIISGVMVFVYNAAADSTLDRIDAKFEQIIKDDYHLIKINRKDGEFIEGEIKQ